MNPQLIVFLLCKLAMCVIGMEPNYVGIYAQTFELFFYNRNGNYIPTHTHTKVQTVK
jgi:hypothetical protein